MEVEPLGTPRNSSDNSAPETKDDTLTTVWLDLGNSTRSFYEPLAYMRSFGYVDAFDVTPDDFPGALGVLCTFGDPASAKAAAADDKYLFERARTAVNLPRRQFFSHAAAHNYHPDDPPAYIAVDTEGLGADSIKYPTIAVAMVVLSKSGKVIAKSQTYLPYKITPEVYEPRCWNEFWSKIDPAILQRTKDKCEEAIAEYKTLENAWANIADAIDRFYGAYDEAANGLVWISDHPGYDMGRINHGLAKYAQREETWYFKGKYHFSQACGFGKAILKAANTKLYEAFKKHIANSPYPTKTHDCLVDACNIGYEVAMLQKALDVMQKQRALEEEYAAFT